MAKKPKPKTAGYVVLAYQPATDDRGLRLGVCAHDDDHGCLMTFSGQDGTLYKNRKAAQQAVAKAQESQSGKPLCRDRQHFVVRLVEEVKPC